MLSREMLVRFLIYSGHLGLQVHWLVTISFSHVSLFLTILLEFLSKTVLEVFILLINVFEVGIFFNLVDDKIFLFLVLRLLQLLGKCGECIYRLCYGL